jgi:hypothetical protein
MLLRIIFFLIACCNVVYSQGYYAGAAAEHCPSPEEKKLYNLINEYRISKQLPEITLSQSLSYVARVHTIDLSQNRPDFGGCNPHSWSGKGQWKPCCYAEDENRVACMTLKPKEITSYKFKAYEAVYSGSEEATADDAFQLWTEVNLVNNLILNTGKWTKPWLAVGVGIYGQYACVWFGEGADHLTGFRTCDDTLRDVTAKDNKWLAGSADGSLYYIITSSVGTLPQAEAEVQKLVQAGYRNACYIQNSTFFRISVNNFKDEVAAYKELEMLKVNFPGAWLLKPQLKN